MKTKLHMYAEGLGQSYVGCEPYDPRLVDSVLFLLVSLVPLAPIILYSSLLEDSLGSA